MAEAWILKTFALQEAGQMAMMVLDGRDTWSDTTGGDRPLISAQPVFLFGPNLGDDRNLLESQRNGPF